MSTSSTEGVAPEGPEETAESRRASLIEAIFDNLSMWTVLAAAISFLYLIWATLDILGRYIGGFPKVGP